MANIKGYTLPTLTSAVGPVLIHKNRPAPNRSTVDQMWSKISTKICSNSIFNNKTELKVKNSQNKTKLFPKDAFKNMQAK